MIQDEIAQVIVSVAKNEDSLLSKIANQGIFHMPELAFVYECGKQIMLNSEKIFGKNHVVWIREKDLGNGGPTDLVFELDNGYMVAIEFKLRDTSHSYIRDVNKLSKLSEKTLKLFCALIDVFDSKLPDDGRQSALENHPDANVKQVKKQYFSTKQNWYDSPTSCHVCVWTIGQVPEVLVTL